MFFLERTKEGYSIKDTDGNIISYNLRNIIYILGELQSEKLLNNYHGSDPIEYLNSKVEEEIEKNELFLETRKTLDEIGIENNLYELVFDGRIQEFYNLTKDFSIEELEGYLDFLSEERKDVFSYIKNSANEGKGRLFFENTKSYFSETLKKIEEIGIEEHYCIGGGTSLTLMGIINRNSEDIDIFCYEDGLRTIKDKIGEKLGVSLKYNQFNGGFQIYFNEGTTDHYKLEVVPFRKHFTTVNVGGIVFMSVEQTLENKFSAILTRDEKRDIYDLAILSFKRFDLFMEMITIQHIKRILLSENSMFGNEKLMKVLKFEEQDKKLLQFFFKFLKGLLPKEEFTYY